MTPRQTIEFGLAQLRHYAQDYGGRKGLAECLWEIRVYEWILNQPDRDVKAETYLNARIPGPGVLIEKRVVIRRLGWDIQ